MLPVTLPDMTDFRPQPQDDDSDPVPALARARVGDASWAEVTLDLGDGPRRYRRELNVMPQWAGSCWYYLRFLDPFNDTALVGADAERYWMRPAGVDLYVGGVEQAVLHLLYARFFHKVLYDVGVAGTTEPFGRLFNQGYILADAFTDARGLYVPAADVTTASGRVGVPRAAGHPAGREDGQEPEERHQPGRHLRRLRRGHAAPVRDGDGPAGRGPAVAHRRHRGHAPVPAAPVAADHRRDHRGDAATPAAPVPRVATPVAAGPPPPSSDPVAPPAGPPAAEALDPATAQTLDPATAQTLDPATARYGLPDPATAQTLDPATARLLHRTSATVGEDFAALRFNTAIARLIELTAHAARLDRVPRALAEPLVLMVAPLAPHIAEELWQRLGHPASLAYEPFPQADPALAAEASVTLPVQVDGKVRFTIEVPASAGQQDIAELLAGHPDYPHHDIARLVIVPGKIVNVVLRRPEPG